MYLSVYNSCVYLYCKRDYLCPFVHAPRGIRLAVQIPIGLEAAHIGSIDLITRRAFTFFGDNGAALARTHMQTLARACARRTHTHISSMAFVLSCLACPLLSARCSSRRCAPLRCASAAACHAQS